MIQHRALALAALLALAPAAMAQRNPAAGDWSKVEPTDLRVLTYNIEDGICSTAVKSSGRNKWTALVCVVAAMRPDVLILQEVGDNSGNGTGNGGDSVADLETTLRLFVRGGNDPFRGGAVGAFVQNLAPDYDLPYIAVSTTTDGFNRNVILSRFPFVDLNGDTRPVTSNFSLFADQYAPGGTAGSRGLLVAEIDLPDDLYAGDLVAGSLHLAAGDAFSERLTASQNIAYFLDYLYNGAGTGRPDPNSKVRDNPAAQSILDENTPIIWGGDLNEDEDTNNRRGPALWQTRAARDGSTDGTDRDRTDAAFDDARDVFDNERETRGASKLDYVLWQDSIAIARSMFIPRADTMPSQAYPDAYRAFPGGAGAVTSWASDHLPVVVDFILPLADVPDCPPDLTGDGIVDGADFLAFLAAFFGNQEAGDFNNDGVIDGADFLAFLAAFFAGC